VRRRVPMLTWVRDPQDGRTPMLTAAQNGHAEVVELLVEAGADTNAPAKVSEGRGGYFRT